jgi:hypothetical protein
MDLNTTLGGLLTAVGVADILLAQVLASRLPPIGRQVLLFGGAGMIVLGSLLVFGILRLL